MIFIKLRFDLSVQNLVLEEYHHKGCGQAIFGVYERVLQRGLVFKPLSISMFIRSPFELVKARVFEELYFFLYFFSRCGLY